LRWWRVFESREIFRVGAEEANFLHNIHLSILEAEFVENDVGFINFAFPTYIKRLGPRMSQQKARLMIEFCDLVPEHLRGKISWQPSVEFKRLAAGASGIDAR
jgi:hypothetical protein